MKKTSKIGLKTIKNSRNYVKSHLNRQNPFKILQNHLKPSKNLTNQSKTIKNYLETSENRNKLLKIV